MFYKNKFFTDYKALKRDLRSEDSDTGTDILVNAPPGFDKPSPPLSHPDHLHRRHHSLHQRKFRRHPDSLGSDGTESSADEEDQNRLTSLSRRRTKSADGRGRENEIKVFMLGYNK